MARRRLALIGRELDLLGTDDEAPSEPGSEPPLRPGAEVLATGRHRARGWLPDTLRGRVALAPQHLALLAVVVALALAVTTWWVVRAAGDDATAEAWAAPAPDASSPDLVEDTGATADEDAEDAEDADDADDADGTVVVHVAGRVRSPGIVTLPLGARVADAITAAGGARPRVDLSSVNLARVLLDGEQVLVGAAAATPPAAAGPATPGAPGATATGTVNLNTATAAELETLNGVGPVTAQAIVAWREEHGRFTAVEELLEVSGIGEKTLAQLAPHVTL